MRCPKCQYISYESGDRCRNCGYEFALAADADSATDELELQLKTGDEPVGPLVDLELTSEAHAPDAVPPVAPPRSTARAPDSTEFPLFRGVDEARRAPAPPPPPRTPMAVRRAAPARPAAQRTEEPELGLEPEPRPPVSRRAVRSEAKEIRQADHESQPAGAGPRLLAALVDVLILGGIDAAILHFTLAITGLSYGEVHIIPLIPFVSFLAILNAGYLVTFTVAGGQTLGKMLAGIKVINGDPAAHTDRVPFAQAVIRAVAVAISVAPAGLGFLVGLISADKRALHDRLAGTRVVRT